MYQVDQQRTVKHQRTTLPKAMQSISHIVIAVDVMPAKAFAVSTTENTMG
jgi:hypothetical protein